MASNMDGPLHTGTPARHADDNGAHPRGVRSFVRREGRITEAQRRALDELGPVYGIPQGGDALDLEQLFGRRSPCFIEIGFGNGEALLSMASIWPERNFVGVEVHRPGIGHLMLELRRRNLDNVRIVEGDAVELISQRLSEHSLSGAFVLFPDPWPKKRHHKRRLINREFLGLLNSRLQPEGALLHLATDWEDYARQMLDLLESQEGFCNTILGGGFAPRPAYRSATRFERRGKRRGHTIFDLLFKTTRGNLPDQAGKAGQDHITEAQSASEPVTEGITAAAHSLNLRRA
jgi:tRNA (guanine-N7-)-methyltransferase